MAKLPLLAEPRETALYPIADAARLLRLPASTLKSWVLGRHFRTSSGEHFSPPIIRLPARQARPKQLSFYNLIEAHVLASMRREHELSMPKIRRALKRVEVELGTKRPLIEGRFQTDGADLLVTTYVGATETQDGQLLLRDLALSLTRIEWDAESRFATRLFPLVRADMVATEEQPKSVMIDPRRAFGRPVLTGTGISTESVAQRHLAGDSIELLARDYDLRPEQVEDAIRCELLRAA